MLDVIYKSVFELSSLCLFFIMIYWLRRAVGSIPLYMLLGTFFAFAQISQMPGFEKMLLPAKSMGMLDNGILLIPVILMYLTIYEEEGTIEAHRFILCMLLSVLSCVYIIQMILVHCEVNLDFSEMAGFLSDTSNFLVPILIMTACQLLLFMVLPVTYQTMRNMHIPTGVAMLLHIYAFICGNNAMLVVCGYSNAHIFPLIEWNVSIVVISFLSHFYLKITCGNALVGKKRPFAIISTLLEHIQSAGRLRQSVEEWEGRYQTVMDNSMEMIFLADKEGNVINANHSAVKQLKGFSEGLNLASIIFKENGEPFDWQGICAPLLNEHAEHQGTEPQPPKTTFFNSMQMKLPDGRVIYVEFNISTARLNDIGMVIVIMRDVTDSHLEEQHRKKLEETLQQSQRIQAVGVLAGGIAHDFNNLLQAIQASTEVIAQQPLDDKSKSMIGNIRNASGRAADLVSKLLGFARKGKYQEKLTNLCNVAQSAADLFEAGLKDVQFKPVLYPEPLMVMADETQLQQVVLKLLLNSRDALPAEGRRRITLRTDKAHGDTDSWKERPVNVPDTPDAYVTLSVKDTGKGMDEETKEKVFEPFYSTKGVNGTGLGMSMVYGCISHHKGWINIKTAPGEGCEITIYLPTA
ncbi:MAG: PAS domain S-box protein [Victivallales bacterium]|nr:PAS domain S-box protein [Victivallales bacterium]